MSRTVNEKHAVLCFLSLWHTLTLHSQFLYSEQDAWWHYEQTWEGPYNTVRTLSFLTVCMYRQTDESRKNVLMSDTEWRVFE